MSESNTTENTITFNDLNLPEALTKVVAEMGYETPSPIQAQTIPLQQRVF